MSLTLSFIVFITSFIALLFAGKMMPRAIGGLAKVLRISEFVAAFILVSFATSLPELFVGVSSAIQGVQGLALGTVIGSNVVNLTLVVGLPVLIVGFIATDGKISRQNYWLIFIIAFLPILLIADGALSRPDGFLLLLAFGLYMRKLFQDKEHFSKVIGEDGKEETPKLDSFRGTFGHLTRFSVASALLLVSAFFLVFSSKIIVTQYFGSDFLLFGLIFIALGTSLPELVFSIRSALDGYSSALLGNALGSVAFNAAAVVGITAIIQPIEADLTNNFWFTVYFLFIAFVLFHFFAYTQNRLSRKEGIVLMLVYLLFLWIAFM